MRPMREPLIVLVSRPAAAAMVAAVLISGTAVSAATAQEREDCAPAGSSIRIQATSGIGGAPGNVTYAVTNHQRESLQWVRIGAGGGAFIALASGQTPAISRTPADWLGIVTRPELPEHSDRVYFQWEATKNEAEVTFRSGTEFGVRAREAYVVRPGLLPVNFTSLPFSAGSRSGACWWGRTTSLSGPVERGIMTDAFGASVRAISGHGTGHVIVDFPSGELVLPIWKPVAVTIPLAVSWGVKGGFSADASIGIGMSWTPSKYVSATAQTRFGTFFFNNRTHLRSVGVDISVPIARTAFAEGLARQSKYLVFGAEYFHRDVVEWKGFIKRPEWYASGHGVAVRVGIRRLTWSY